MPYSIGRRMVAQCSHASDESAGLAPRLIKRTELADNDAGVRTTQLNFTKRTGMLEGLRHDNASTFRRLMALGRDRCLADGKAGATVDCGVR